MVDAHCVTRFVFFLHSLSSGLSIFFLLPKPCHATSLLLSCVIAAGPSCCRFETVPPSSSIESHHHHLRLWAVSPPKNPQTPLETSCGGAQFRRVSDGGWGFLWRRGSGEEGPGGRQQGFWRKVALRPRGGGSRVCRSRGASGLVESERGESFLPLKGTSSYLIRRPFFSRFV